MSAFVDKVEYYYKEGFYNCAEALIRGASDYYELDISEGDCLLFGGYGSGMYSGLTCGALDACVAVISRLYVKRSARREIETIRPLVQKMVRNFRDKLSAVECVKLRPLYYSKEESCWQTVKLAAEALEETINEIEA